MQKERMTKRTAYVEGNTARKLQAAQAPKVDKQAQRRSSQPARHANRSQAQVQQLGMGYVLVMTVCAVITMWICASYLQLQAENTRSLKNIASLENQLSELKTENDDEYNRLMSSVDLNSIRETAINELGMVYANADQIVLYDSHTNDYVRQFGEIPQEESSLLSALVSSK